MTLKTKGHRASSPIRGNWRSPWGEIKRFQRNNADITQHFDDARPSMRMADSGRSISGRRT
jgi:hypothetical protein